MNFADLHLTESVARALTRLGWTADDPRLRDVAPSVARGQNLVAVSPPTPACAAPLLAGLLSRELPAGADLLVLAPPASLPEWGTLLGVLGLGTPLAPLVALGPGLATRRLGPGAGGNLLVAAPATALDLRRRSLLRPETLAAVVIAWPETWEDQETLALVLQEVPREAQRLILTCAPEQSAALAERYAWRALTAGSWGTVFPQGPVRTLPVPWSRRIATLAELVESLDAATVAVWTADAAWHDELQRLTTGLGLTASITSSDVPAAAEVIAFDPPSPARLTQLLASGRVTLMMPPGTEGYLARIAAPRAPMQLPGELEAAAGDAARRRMLLERILSAQPLSGELAILAPLFERHGSVMVAAAAYHLWAAEAGKAARPAEPAPRSLAKIWVGAGRRDEVGPNDFVGLLVNELRVERSHIGKIEVQESFSLIEVPADEAERIAGAVAGRTVKRKRLAARVDRKPAARGGKRPPRA